MVAYAYADTLTPPLIRHAAMMLLFRCFSRIADADAAHARAVLMPRCFLPPLFDAACF